MKRPTKFWTRKVDSVNVVDVTGRLAPEGSDDALYKVISNLIEAGERNFLVDLSSTTFISSSGLGSLLRSANAVEAAEGQFKLLSPSHSVARILELSRMTDVFEILHNEQEAVASYTAPAKAAKAPKADSSSAADSSDEAAAPEPAAKAEKAAKKPAKPRKSRKKTTEETGDGE